MSDVLELTRGDTGLFSFQRLDDNGDPILTQANEVYFTVKRRYTDKAFLVQKTLADMTFDGTGVYHFTLEPEDTEGLPYGVYVFDVEVIVEDYKQTIAKGELNITAEATWKVNEG